MVATILSEAMKMAFAAPTGALFGVAYGTSIRIGYEILFPLLFPPSTQGTDKPISRNVTKSAIATTGSHTVRKLASSNSIENIIEQMQKMFTTVGGLEAHKTGMVNGVMSALGIAGLGFSSPEGKQILGDIMALLGQPHIQTGSVDTSVSTVGGMKIYSLTWFKSKSTEFLSTMYRNMKEHNNPLKLDTTQIRYLTTTYQLRIKGMEGQEIPRDTVDFDEATRAQQEAQAFNRERFTQLDTLLIHQRGVVVATDLYKKNLSYNKPVQGMKESIRKQINAYNNLVHSFYVFIQKARNSKNEYIRKTANRDWTERPVKTMQHL